MSDMGLGVIGGGNMAQAILRGGLQSGRIRADRVVVAEPDAEKRALLEGWGVTVHPTPAEALAAAEPPSQVLLAVKPQVFPSVADQIRGRVDGVVMTIMAGLPSESIKTALGPVRVIRLMPNTPARVGKGMTALALGAGSTAGDQAFARTLFEAVGEVIELDESLMDAFTGAAGSGPAYVFYLAEAMVRGAVDVGLAPDEADRIVRATIAGAAALLEESADAPSALRAAVTSKGGTTAAAVGVLDESHVMEAVQTAVAAARDRGRALAQG